MGLRMKKLEYFWVSLKNLIFFGGGEGGFTKRPIYRGNCPKRGGGLGHFADLRESLARKRGWCF